MNENIQVESELFLARFFIVFGAKDQSKPKSGLSLQMLRGVDGDV
jgi:hypothetical protein